MISKTIGLQIRYGYFANAGQLIDQHLYFSKNNETISKLYINKQLIETYKILLGISNNFKDVTKETISIVDKNLLHKVYYNIALVENDKDYFFECIKDKQYNKDYISSCLADYALITNNKNASRNALHLSTSIYNTLYNCAVYSLLTNDDKMFKRTMHSMQKNGYVVDKVIFEQKWGV